MTTYAELEADISSWLWRDDAELLNKIPTLIKLGESRMNRVLRLHHMLVRARYSGLDSRFIPIPGAQGGPKMLEMRSLRIKSTANERWNDQLIQVSPEGLAIQSLDKPTRYCIHNEIELDAALSSAYDLEMVYYTPFDAITQSSGNWVLENAYDVYLYGSLAEAEPFLRNDERVPVWTGRWQVAVDELMDAEMRSRRNQSEVRQMLDAHEWAP